MSGAWDTLPVWRSLKTSSLSSFRSSLRKVVLNEQYLDGRIEKVVHG